LQCNKSRGNHDEWTYHPREKRFYWAFVIHPCMHVESKPREGSRGSWSWYVPYTCTLDLHNSLTFHVFFQAYRAVASFLTMYFLSFVCDPCFACRLALLRQYCHLHW
jgi:hypothetical protein